VEQQWHYLKHQYRERLIAWRPMLTEDTTEWAGTAMLVELPNRDAAEVLIAHDPGAIDRWYTDIEIHHWQFGGRPDEAERRRKLTGGGPTLA
jgi:uncharacterized protein